MGVKHQLILGVILTCLLHVYRGSASEVNNTIRNVTEVVDRNINLIEKLPKTDIEQKIIHSNTQEHSTNNKQNETQIPEAEEHRDDDKESKEENAIKQEGDEKHREENSRSIDIEKYVSPEFQNNVFTLPNFQDTEKIVDDHFDYKQSTEKTPFPEFDLTTPKSDLFDNKYKEVIQKLEQEFEDTQNDNEHDTDDDNEHEQELRENNDDESDEDEEMQVEKLLDEPKVNPNSTLDYKEMKNIIVKNNTAGKKSTRNNVIVEKVKRVNFVSNFSDTKSYGYDLKDNVTETTPKTISLTTRKSVELTKPPNNKNNSHILSNKIETETIKAINLVTSELPTTKLIVDTEQSKENQIISSNVTFTTTTENVNNNETTTTTETVATATVGDVVSTVTNGEEPTTLRDISTTDTNDFTTTLEPTTAKTTTEVVMNELTTSTLLSDATVTTITDGTTIIDEQKFADTTSTTVTSTTLVTTTEDKVTSTQEPKTETTVTDEATTTAEYTSMSLWPKLLDVFPDNSSTTVVVTTTNTVTPTITTELIEDKFTTITTQPNTTMNHVETTSNTTLPSSKETTLNNEIIIDELTEVPAGSTDTSIGTDSPDDGTKGKVVVIVISSVGAVCLVLLALLLYVMRKRQNKFNYKQRCRPVSLDDYSVDNVSAYNSVRRKGDRQSKRSYGNPAFDDPSVPTHPLNFPALAKFASNAEDIKSEFEDIPQITARTSELPEGCEPKNRYANVIPLPETRVYLQPIDGYPTSDYINANYVTGPKNTKGFYIACQAPMQNTVDDFWRMVWEQQTKVILMMTNFFENGVEKCVDYLPPSEVLDCHRLFGDFQVTLKKRDVKEKYIISSLQLKNMVSNSWREVTHFWYLGWPEKGVPIEANSIIAFLIEARSYMKTSTLDRNELAKGTNNLPRSEVNPVVVHCSPGTGRTGVLIACDIAIREFEQTRLVDIPKMVYRIRRDRASAVQTKEQYMFVYKVVSLYATKLTGGALESF